MSKAGFDPERLARVSHALQRFVDSGDVAGIVTLVWRHGEIAHVDTLGWRDLETQASDDPRHVCFRIASMTKPVTSVAALMLVEEGRLDFESPASKWLPELANLAVLASPDAPLDQTEPIRAPITLVEPADASRRFFAYHFTADGALARSLRTRVSTCFDMMVDPGALARPRRRASADVPAGHALGITASRPMCSARWSSGVRGHVARRVLPQRASSSRSGCPIPATSCRRRRLTGLSTSYAVEGREQESGRRGPSGDQPLDQAGPIPERRRRTRLDRRRLSALRAHAARPAAVCRAMKVSACKVRASCRANRST